MIKHRYVYNGPVMEFDRLICNKWHGETIATSEKKALSNLSFQFKRDNGRLPNTRVSLLPKYIKEVEAVME